MISSPPIAAALRLWEPRTTTPKNTDHALVAKVRDAASQLSSSTDAQLAQLAIEWRQRVQTGTAVTSDEVVIPIFALIVEATRRVLGIGLYDVQLLGGLALARGAIAEMQTGEGKTYVAMLPAALHALAGGVHVMTVNSYLAGRDFELLAPIYRRLGFSVGLVDAESNPASKRAAYACDITYGPGYEFGFDYLRDQVALLSRPKPRLGEGFRARLRGEAIDSPKPMQRGHFMAIVDEADSVMIDEATTPLILSTGGPSTAANADVYRAAVEAAERLECDKHYVVDRPAATLHLTPIGLQQVAADPQCVSDRGLDRPWPVYVEQALRSALLFRRDVDYVVDDDKILLVDQNTGRILADRSWRDGLQQAVQAKEGVTITTETKSIARITRQRYFRRYEQLCGMTGTAQGSERELRQVYGLNVAVIPQNRPCVRSTLPTRLFADAASKEAAIVADVARIHQTSQPVLVGTVAIETSERLARSLDDLQIPYQLLNGRQDAEEAAIVAAAGQLGVVTIATNMAGRGTDICLGPGVAERGGLHVIATEPQESVRIDRQLIGRAARQGDPGSCQLFASADDRLFTRHAPALAERMKRLAGASGEIRADLSRDISAVQRRVENAHAKQRRQMFAHDDWLETVLRDLASE